MWYYPILQFIDVLPFKGIGPKCTVVQILQRNHVRDREDRGYLYDRTRAADFVLNAHCDWEGYNIDNNDDDNN